MPFIILYFIKLSVSVAVVFLFYYFVLRKLTFYNWNRWYLLGYTLLSFFIPFINISPVLDKYEWLKSEAITWVPVMGNPSALHNSGVLRKGLSFTVWQWLVLLVLAGAFILLIRLLLQYVSYRRMLGKASIISSGEMNLYQVNDNIAPFSFGHSIFINRNLLYFLKMFKE